MMTVSRLSRRRTLGMFGTLSAFSGASAAAESKTDTDPIIDVRSAYGAIGDGVHDDTEALQSAINDLSLGRRGGILFLQAGTYRVTKTLKFPVGAGGGIICGSGCYPGDPRPKKKRTGPHTIIVWDGEAGGTMFSAEGNLGWKISSITFVGSAIKGGARRAGVIYHCRYNKEFGSGEGIFEACWFIDAEIAIKMGDYRLDDGCADFVFIQVCFVFCDVGVHVGNLQGVNYNFLYVAASYCKSVIVAAEGGHFYIQNAQVVGCGDPERGAWPFDFRKLNDNVSVVSINGLRVEQRTRPVLRAAGTGRVTIVGYEEAQVDQATTMIEFSGVSATISQSRVVTHSRQKPHVTLAPGAQPSRFVGTAIYFDSEVWELDDWLGWTPESRAVVERCFFSNRGTGIPFWTNDPLIGPVVLSGMSEHEREIELAVLGKSGIDISRVGASKMLTVTVLATNFELGETVSYKEEYLISGSNIVKVTSEGASPDFRWGTLGLRFSEDRSKARFFVRPRVRTRCAWRCLVSVTGL